MSTTSVKISSKAPRSRSERNRFTVMWSSGLMPHSHMKHTSSRVARAILREEYTPLA